tara:strand:+ start:514 stop:945 length:432 start_codon:yes stop_codon:yes gene_type:complete
MELMLDNYEAHIPGLPRYTIAYLPNNYILLDLTMMLLKLIYKHKKCYILSSFKPYYHKDWLFYPNWFKVIRYKMNNNFLPLTKPFAFFDCNKLNLTITINIDYISNPITNKDISSMINYYKYLSLLNPPLPNEIIKIIYNFIL